MDSAPHVLDLDVPEPGGGFLDALQGRRLLQALAVADVEGEAERSRVAEEAAQVVEVGEGGEEVTGFRLDGERCAGPVGRFEYGGDRFGEPLPRDVRRGAGRGDAAEAVDGVRAEFGGHVDSADQQGGAGGPGVGVRVEEGGAVLAARVEDIAGAGLHGDPEPEEVAGAGPGGCAR